MWNVTRCVLQKNPAVPAVRQQRFVHLCSDLTLQLEADLPGSELIRLAITYVSEALEFGVRW